MQHRTETEIRNVLDFFKWVKDTFLVEYCVDGKTQKWPQDKVYYRGHSDYTWELSPGVFRKEETSCGELKKVCELDILDKATRMLWAEFSHFTTYLEKLVYLQHYGLKTRLLDVTFNPLIALYFACLKNPKKENETDGIVYCGHQYDNKKENYNMYDIPELTAKCLFTQPSLCNLITWCDNNCCYIESFTTPMFIHPPINNPRVEAQNGAFIMAPLAKKVEGGYIINRDNLEVFFEHRVAKIPAECKENILKELAILGINAGSIFRGVTEKLQTIMLEDGWETHKEIELDDYLH